MSKKAGAKIRMSLRKATLGLLVCGLVALTACAPYIEDFTPEKGPVGTKVTIKGKRFANTISGNTVKFGGITVSTTDIITASTTMLKAKVPNGAQTGLITITTSKGTGESKKNFRVSSPTTAEWTFMVYLDADNNLEEEGIEDFLEMASIGSSAGVDIVVQMDRVDGYEDSHGDWKDTRRFHIQNNDDPSVVPVQNLGEQNMGDPAVLQDFVEWAVTNYPAERYALIIWNHGDGWRKHKETMAEMAQAAKSRGKSDWAVAKGVATDETDQDKLYMKEVQTALEGAKQRLEERNNTVVKLDVVGFDACLMQLVEVAYALRNVANYVVGSEYTEPLNGWPYGAILGTLDATPSLSPEDLASTIVTNYVNSYPASSAVTQSAVNVAKLGNLVNKIDAFTNQANTEWDKLKTARTNTREFHHPFWCGPYCWGADLWGFADQVNNLVTSSSMQSAALDLRNAVDDCVISEGHGSGMSGSHGIAIYFPSTRTVFNNDPDHIGYEESNTFMPVDFIKYSKWDNWLQDFYSNIP